MALRTLYQSFLHSDLGRLRIIAQQWSLEPYAVRHTDMAAELVDAMVNENAVSMVLSKLPEAHRDALNALLRRDAKMPWASFLRRWGPMRDIGMGKMEREELWREPISAAEALWMLGLVQRDFSDHPSDPIEMAYVPEELSLYIPAPAPLIVSPPQPKENSVGKINTAVDDSLAEGLVTCWVTLQRRNNESSETSNQRQARVSLLEAISLEQGWTRKTKTQELRLVPDPVLTWLRSDLWEQWSSVTRAWMSSTHWRDIDYVKSLQPDPVHDWSPDPVQTRQAVLDSIMLCTPNTWYDISDFIVYMKTHATDFMRLDGNYDRWAPRDAQSGHPLRGYECWELIEGAYIRFLITGPLTWLGVVSVETLESDNSGIDNFYLTVAGGSLLGLCEPPEIKVPPRININSSGVIDVPGRRRYERYQLSRIAQLVDHDNVYRFRITPSSLKRAQQQRIPFSRIVSFLEQATERTLPVHLKTAIQRLFHNNEGASLENHWILRLSDPDDCAIPALQNLVFEQLTPNIVLVREQDLNSVLTILVENGILVDVNEL